MFFLLSVPVATAAAPVDVAAVDLNKLAAKAAKAKIMGKHAEHAALTKQVTHDRQVYLRMWFGICVCVSLKRVHLAKESYRR